MNMLVRIRSIAPLLALSMIAAPIAAVSAQDVVGAETAAGENAEQIADAMPSLDPSVESLPEVPAQTLSPAPAQTTFQNPPETVRMVANPVVQDVPLSPPALSNDPFVIKSILPIEGSIRYGEWYWDETRAPENGKLVVTVDLDARVVSVFRDGHEIGTAVALLGTQKHPTPLGAFPILTKEKDNISEKYNNAPMPWTLRLTWDGIAIHGSPVLNGYASHGCVGVPNPFAEKLFAIAKRGDKVVITRGEMIGLGDKIIG